MIKMSFYDNLTQHLLKDPSKISCTYHINSFDWPEHHAHTDYWEFTILTHGTIINHLNDHTETYHKDTLFFSTTQDHHYIKKAPNCKTIRYINILVKDTYLAGLLDHIAPSFSSVLLNAPHHYALPASLVESIEKIIHKLNLLTSSQYHIYNNLLCSALLLILQFIFSKNIDIFENTPLWMNKLSSITLKPEFLNYTVADLCRELNYSNAQLTRVFRLQLNMTPHEYIIEWKFRYARSLLKTTDMNILDIAMKIGYSNLSQFNTLFKKKFSVTPGQYRKQNKNPRH